MPVSLKLLGKHDHRIIAVYAASRQDYARAVEYVRAEAPQYPVWLLATGPVDPAVAALCERVISVAASAALPLTAARALWPHWVALNVVTYTGEAGFGWLKAAPFFVFPWKLLVMNEHRDFFAALPFGLLLHLGRRARDGLLTAAESVKDLVLGVFWKAAWTVLDLVLRLTGQPWLEPQQPLELGECRGERQLIVDDPEAPGGDLRDLEALFERPDTFAAGFQPGQAGFQKDTLPRAAFRQLQPGEATAVLAPMAGVVMVDSEKLARLGGFPRAHSRRCQWLLLYWKAARAGWKSYSVGVEHTRLPMIPDRAGAEFEFCRRLLGELPRPRPVPGNFAGLRGSISTQPRLQGPWRPGRRRILVVSPYLPYPLTHGGAVRMFYLARELSQRYDLLLVTFRERNDEVDYARLAGCFARVLVVDHDERRRPDPTVPEAVAQCRTRAMDAAIRQAGEEYKPDILQVEYTHMAGYREALPGAPAVLVEHDVTFSLYEQLGDGRQFELWHRFESHWLGRYDAVAVMSGDEAAKAHSAGAPAGRTWVVPNGVDTERFTPAAEPAGPPELLYVGSFRHLPNVLGFEHLRREILPRLWQRSPQVRLRVVAGPDYHRFWQRQTVDPRIQLQGFVADIAPCYARSQIVVVPLVVSAGTNIKVMEALACGRPVVSTAAGCAGLGLRDGEEILVASDPEAFVAALERLIADPQLRRRIGENARQAALARFSWKRAAARAEEMYEAL